MVNSVTTTGIMSMMKSLAKAPKVNLSDYMDPEKQKEADKVKANLQQALSTMKDSNNQISKQRKSMAAQKVAMIKQQLETLKQTPGMDPKAVARMAAMLAKQLAQAIKEYAAAGATTTEVQSASGGGAAPAADASADPAAASGAEAPPPADIAEPEPKVPTPDETKAIFQTNQYDKTGKAKDDDGDSKTIRVKDDDSGFLKDVKKIVEDLKNLLEIQKARLNRNDKKDKDALEDVAAGEKALQAAEKSIRTIVQQGITQGLTGGASLSIMA